MTARPNASLYDRDFFAWTQEQAAALRRVERHLGGRGVDVERLAEEIEDMGRRERRELESRLLLIIIHLLKWQFQPSHRGESWMGTLNEQRARIEKLLRDSPSLRPGAAAVLEEEYARARRNAATETGQPIETFPGRCPYTLDQVVDDEFLPEV